MTRLGYQIPNFTYPDTGPADLFATIARQAREADASGFDTVLVMDHFYQLPMLGTPDEYMLECYTLLAGLAGVTSIGAAQRAGDGQHLPEPGGPGQDRHHARRRVGRAGPARHRRRLVRARAQRLRHRVRHVHRPLREAGGGAADHHPDAAGRAGHVGRASTTRSSTPSTRRRRWAASR